MPAALSTESNHSKYVLKTPELSALNILRQLS